MSIKYYKDDNDVITNFIEEVYHDDFSQINNIMEVALDIYDKEFETNLAPLGLFYHVKIVALLYGVIYLTDDEDKNFELEQLLRKELLPETITLYLDIVHRISYENEVKMRESLGGLVDWETKIGEFGMYIRNIVSDAEKIVLMLGMSGHDKLKEHYKKKYKFSDCLGEERELFKHVDKYIKKRIQYISKYLTTKTGKKLGLNKRSELYIAHEDWRKKLIL